MIYLWIALALLALLRPLEAQQGGYISGVVQDRSGALVGNAQVRLQNQQTGARQTISGDTSGTYSSSELMPGKYNIVVRSPGFRTNVRTDVEVVAGKTSRADFTIELLPFE